MNYNVTNRGLVKVTVLEDHPRIDTYLFQQPLELTRSRIKHLIVEGFIKLNGNDCKVSQRLYSKDEITISTPEIKQSKVIARKIPLNIIFQDESLLVIDKDAGVPVHPGPGHEDDTLVNGLLYLCPDLQGIGDEIRPGIVHRLDKDTSGLIVVAKSNGALISLSEQMKSRQVFKEYITLVQGDLRDNHGFIEAPIGRHPKDRKKMAVIDTGRYAKTEYSVLQRGNGLTLLKIILHTGRTHQIRVHMAYKGCKMVGDSVYGVKFTGLERQFLHARSLGFTHPVTLEPMVFQSVLPESLDSVLKELGFDASLS
ncbi:MAG TPA: RNA pseudouridine synthase [Dehalococcoidia bacterium]|jgi:23S rRNA pseudouridine1911/1915/1917 synthase|nr:RNA pseudouridine synthase [Dehalococcoidia bacterium]